MLFTGYALSASSICAVIQGCQADTTTAAADWSPGYLTSDDYTLIGEIAETMLPRTTDSPGAKDVYVHRFIDTFLSEYVTTEEKEGFDKTLETFKTKCQDANGKSCVKLSKEEQLAYLNDVNQEAIQAAETDASGFSAGFLQLKSLITMGYFTSEKVGEEVLAYDPIPGMYDGCASLEEVTQGRNWSL